MVDDEVTTKEFVLPGTRPGLRSFAREGQLKRPFGAESEVRARWVASTGRRRRALRKLSDSMTGRLAVADRSRSSGPQEAVVGQSGLGVRALDFVDPPHPDEKAL